jgi:hypothetical protein
LAVAAVSPKPGISETVSARNSRGKLVSAKSQRSHISLSALEEIQADSKYPSKSASAFYFDDDDGDEVDDDYNKSFKAAGHLDIDEDDEDEGSKAANSKANSKRNTRVRVKDAGKRMADSGPTSQNKRRKVAVDEKVSLTADTKMIKLGD